MNRRFRPMHGTTNRGFALPMILVFLVVFNIIGLILVSRFSTVGQQEALQSELASKKRGDAYAGIELTKYNLARPDCPSTSTSTYHWTDSGGYATPVTKTMSFNGQNVTITIEQGVLPN